MKKIRTLICTVLSAAMIFSQASVSLAESFYRQSFVGFDGGALPSEFSVTDVRDDRDRGARLDISKTETDSGGTAVLMQAQSGNFDPQYSPALVLNLEEEIGGYVTLGMDINVKAAPNGSAFAMNIANAKDFYFDYTQLVFNGDGSCGYYESSKKVMKNYELDRWYRLEVTFNFEQKQYNASLTDKATGEKSEIVPLRDLPTSKYSTGLKTIEFSLLSASSAAIANIEIADADFPAQIIPKVQDSSYLLSDMTEYRKADWTDGKVDYGAALFRVYFNTELDESTVSGVYLSRGGEILAEGSAYNPESNSVDIELPPLSANKSYDVVISDALLSSTGAAAKEQTISFTVSNRELVIDAPSDGKTADDGTIECKWRFPGNFRDMQLLLDGKKIAAPPQNEGGIYTAELDEASVSYGEHELTVYVADKSGQKYEKSVTFTAAKYKETTELYDFDSWDGKADTYMPHWQFVAGGAAEGPMRGTGEDASPCFKAVFNLIAGKNNESFFNVYSLGNPSELITEFDFFCGEDDGIKIKREMYAGKDASGSNLWNLYDIGEQSYIGESHLGDGNWHKIKIAENISGGSYTIYVDGAAAAAGTLANKKSERAKLVLSSAKSESAEILVDNFSVTEREPYAQPDKTSYIIAGKEYGDANVSAEAESIKQYFTKGFNKDSINKDSVSLYCGEKKITLENVFYNETDYSVVAVPAEKLTPGSRGRLVISQNAAFSDMAPLGRSFDIGFDISSEGFGVKSFSLSLNGEAVRPSLIADGDYPCGAAELFNNSDETKKITVVMSFYRGGELVGIKSKTAEVPSGGSVNAEIENTDVAYSDGMTIKLSAIDTWQNRRFIAYKAF